MYTQFHVPSLLISPKVWACWQKDRDLKVKFLWVWKRWANGYMKEPFCAKASACYQLSSPFTRHQGTPSGVPWKSDFPVSQSWTPCSCWLFWYRWNREMKAGLKNWSLSLVLHFLDSWVSLAGCVLDCRESPSLLCTPSGYLFCYRAI